MQGNGSEHSPTPAEVSPTGLVGGLSRRFAERWISRRHPQSSGPITIPGSRVYILPTFHGWLYATLLLVLFLGSLNYQNSLAFALTFTLAGVGLVSMRHTQRNLAGLRVAVGTPQAAFAGGEVRFSVSLGCDRRTRYSVRLSCAGGATSNADVHPSSGSEIQLGVPAPRRGRLRPGRLLIASRYPVGLFRAWTWVNTPIEALVYPRPAGERALPTLGRGSAANGAGRDEREEEFEGLRAYRIGDTPRQVAWKASARGRGMQSKVFRGSAASALWLREPDSVGDLERSLSQLCVWILEASRQDLQYGLRLRAIEIEPGRGKAHRQRCLETLACYLED
jgi:uncharacterized protein (DUF58 family)